MKIASVLLVASLSMELSATVAHEFAGGNGPSVEIHIGKQREPRGVEQGEIENDENGDCDEESSQETAAPCPTEKGYELFSFPDMDLCIRYNLTKTYSQQEARRFCEADCGHLVLLENESMRLHLVEIATNLMAPPTEYIYFDGMLMNDNGLDIFVNWKGEEMSWIPWHPDNTLNRENKCIDTKLVDGFLLWDWKCEDTAAYFLCQIDV